jgi:filamentous hemagglutinin
LKGAATAAVTAGLTNGITYTDAGGFDTLGWSDSVVNNPDTLANLGGSQVVGTNLVKAAAGEGVSNLGQRVVAMAASSTLKAGVSSIINGGSFSDALASNLVNTGAAAGANAIGSNFAGVGMEDATAGSITANIMGHALVGCAASSLNGGDCASGAVGGATSALVAPLIRDSLYNGTQTVQQVVNKDGTVTVTTSYDNQNYNAATVALSMLAGSAMAGTLGQDKLAAANAAANEAINNATAVKTVTVPALIAVPTPAGMVMVPAPVAGAMGIPGKPNQQGEDDYGVISSPNQSGLFTNTGTTLPAWVESTFDTLRVLPDQAGQWVKENLGKPTACAVSILFCGAQVIMSVSNDDGIGRSGALNDAKRDLGIPSSQHPDTVNSVPMTDRNGKSILGPDGKPIMTREYTYTRPDGSKVLIQDHSAGHQFDQGGVGDQGPHFNVRPVENPRTGSVSGTKDHYSW